MKFCISLFQHQLKVEKPPLNYVKVFVQVKFLTVCTILMYTDLF